MSINFVKGEVFSLKTKQEFILENISDGEINEKYRKGEMRIITEQGRINLDSIVAILESKQGDKKKYILNPEYQRRKRWDTKRKSLLIETFIMNVPLPPIYLYEIEYAIYEVMDGLQRLTAIYDFYKGKFALEGLEYWQELNGKKYEELPTNVKGGIDRRYLSSIILLEETAKNKEEAEFLKQIVFERLNSGGEKLTPQETRNALHNGKFNKLCIRLAKNDLFRKMWHLPLESEGEEKLLESESYRKMEDVELVLRFFAYRHVEQLASPIDKFLDAFLKQANRFSDQTIIELEDLFIKTISTVHTIFEDTAFLLPTRKKDYKPPSKTIYDPFEDTDILLPTREKDYKSPSKTIYDPIMQTFAMNIAYFENFIAAKTDIKQAYKEANFPEIDGKYLFDGRYNNRKDVEARIAYFNDFLQTYIS